MLLVCERLELVLQYKSDFQGHSIFGDLAILDGEVLILDPSRTDALGCFARSSDVLIDSVVEALG
jgi:hypothetical protein